MLCKMNNQRGRDERLSESGRNRLPLCEMKIYPPISNTHSKLTLNFLNWKNMALILRS